MGAMNLRGVLYPEQETALGQYLQNTASGLSRTESTVYDNMLFSPISSAYGEGLGAAHFLGNTAIGFINSGSTLDDFGVQALGTLYGRATGISYGETQALIGKELGDPVLVQRRQVAQLVNSGWAWVDNLPVRAGETVGLDPQIIITNRTNMATSFGISATITPTLTDLLGGMGSLDLIPQVSGVSSATSALAETEGIIVSFPRTPGVFNYADWADQVAAIRVARTGIPSTAEASLKLQWVETWKLQFPEERLVADAQKLADMGPFDWKLYNQNPAWVTKGADGGLTVTNGVTRVTAARLKGVKMLPVYVFSEK
jgi:hypothetical protein